MRRTPASEGLLMPHRRLLGKRIDHPAGWMLDSPHETSGRMDAAVSRGSQCVVFRGPAPRRSRCKPPAKHRVPLPDLACSTAGFLLIRRSSRMRSKAGLLQAFSLIGRMMPRAHPAPTSPQDAIRSRFAHVGAIRGATRGPLAGFRAARWSDSCLGHRGSACFRIPPGFVRPQRMGPALKAADPSGKGKGRFSRTVPCRRRCSRRAVAGRSRRSSAVDRR